MAAPENLSTQDFASVSSCAIRDTCLKTLEDNKAEDIVTIDVRERCSFTDYMIFASGGSTKKMQALADFVQRALKREQQMNTRVEGATNADWILIDAIDVVIHLFRPEVRRYYDLESTWRN